MSGPQAAVLEHARRVVEGESSVAADLAPGASLEPADLLDRLQAWRFRESELVAHARIGAHHIFKTRFVGAAGIVVIQARWAEDPDGRWRIREAEIVRITDREA